MKSIHLNRIYCRATLIISAFFSLISAESKIIVVPPLIQRSTVASWTFDSVADSTYYDATGHGYDAVSTGKGLKIAKGISGNALSCSGNEFEITVKNSKDDFCLKTFSIECWYNPSRVPKGVQQKLFDFETVSPGMGVGYTLCLVENGYVDMAAWGVQRDYWVESISHTTLLPGNWYHLAGIFDGTSLKVYINGKLENSVSCAGGPLYPVPFDARIGCVRTSDERGVIYRAEGLLDEVKLYNYPLSADTIAAHSSVVNPKTTVAFWTFDSIADSTYYDATGHGYDAVSTGKGLTIAKGISGNALSCSGNEFEITVKNSKDDFCLKTFSIECWYNPNSIPQSVQHKLFNFASVSPGIGNGFSFYVIENGYVDMTAWGVQSDYWVRSISHSALLPGKWYHLVGTFDGTALNVYINGTLENSVTCNGGPLYPVSIDARIGCIRTSDSRGVIYRADGLLDEVKLYNYPLPVDTIAAHFRAVYPTPQLIPYIPNPTFNRRPILHWYSNKSISSYRVQISTKQNFSSLFASVPITDTVYQPAADLPFGTIYWRVGNDADTPVWSETSSITIKDSLIPILIPYKPDPTINRKPQLLWHPVKEATSYTIQIATTPGFSSLIVTNVIADSSFTPEVNLPVGYIYWRVKSNLSSEYSNSDTICIQNDSIPRLIPIVPDTIQNRKPKFKWHHSTGASSYQIQIDTIGNFSSPYISIPVVDTFFTPPVNLPVKKIYWRVGSDVNARFFSTPDTFLIIPKLGVDQKAISSQLKHTSPSMKALSDGISISFITSKPGNLSLRIFSLSGSCVAKIQGDIKSSGEHTFAWHGTDNNGCALPNGNYLAVCTVNGLTLNKRIILMR